MTTDWPAQYSQFWLSHPASPLRYGRTQAAALERLERHMDEHKRKAAAEAQEHQEGDELTRKEYLGGSLGQRDRDTIWKAGAGTLPGTGKGGLVEDWLSDAN